MSMLAQAMSCPALVQSNHLHVHELRGTGSARPFDFSVEMVDDNGGLSHPDSEQMNSMHPSSLSHLPSYFLFQPDVKAALVDGRPVVALESTVIAHGLPYPENVETALAMEAAVRDGGATPATLAIIRGEVHIGLTAGEVEYLGSGAEVVAGSPVRKCSRRDIPIALARGEDGATTVAATMLLAHLAGIRVFATGGIGGVHRGHPFDISADLTELGRTPVAVVCSGAKSILDLPATREVLETNGVPVIGYGTDELPAFFSRSSGLGVDARLDTPEEVAAFIKVHLDLELQSGILVVVPVPEEAALDDQDVEAAVEQATDEADSQGLSGPSTTPWLLRRLAQLTEGRSLRSNVILLRHNGLVAGRVAAALSRDSRDQEQTVGPASQRI